MIGSLRVALVGVMIGFEVLSTTASGQALPTTVHIDTLFQTSARQIAVNHVTVEAKWRGRAKECRVEFAFHNE
ncbi:hypothetical protein OKW34_002818 [Paraburkholderia youngii]|uniref:hypothetical protein n=1 Tax=Paraburkholderia youngii TaxID=2782701 RepID=UPI0001821A24|nr:hypothetical protein BH160DRAFT_1478 [Burkholderia sp. H160]